MFIGSRTYVHIFPRCRGIFHRSSGRQMVIRDPRAVLMQINSWSITWKIMWIQTRIAVDCLCHFRRSGATFLDPTAYYYSILEPRGRHGRYNSQTDSAILRGGETFLKEKEKNVFMFANTFLHLQMYCEYKKLN
jgi:hypothetical protein